MMAFSRNNRETDSFIAILSTWKTQNISEILQLERLTMAVNYDYYRIFYYVAKYRSFTRAAEILMSSQPNITRTMNNLENELSCKLFLRTNRGVTLTPEGEKLFSHVKIAHEQLQTGELELAKGVSYKFAGNYEQQERATARLMIVVPLALLIVLLVLYFQFKTITASLIHFSGVFVAFAGGFILLWLYGQDWFMNFSLAGVNMRDLFQMHTINLSVAVWVGFIALFGVATDDGVLMGTYIHHVFLEKNPQTKHDIREAVVTAGLKRVRPAAMTTATTLIALLPVLTSTGKGADIMVPMAIPTFGGMLIQSMTMFVVPVFQCWWREGLLKKEEKARNTAENSSPGK